MFCPWKWRKYKGKYSLRYNRITWCWMWCNIFQALQRSWKMGVKEFQQVYEEHQNYQPKLSTLTNRSKYLNTNFKKACEEIVDMLLSLFTWKWYRDYWLQSSVPLWLDKICSLNLAPLKTNSSCCILLRKSSLMLE